ncbi:hypothetical protein L3Y34_017084 [Caenorhabditis briggsae]|uniref:Uncharacterized protein n=1 Tax=Caenorhabditis briggsae TaxID=6238 RepID=A0AAE9DHK6_CAEBR|nr:hypothetical protein L3Y34_017084 [Caenorhabditis briggsae]
MTWLCVKDFEIFKKKLFQPKRRALSVLKKDLRDVATLEGSKKHPRAIRIFGKSLGDVKDNDQQNSSIWKADLSSGSNGDRNVSMEFKNAPSAALSTFSQILKIGTSTMDSTDFPRDVDGLRLEISVNLIVFSVVVLGFGVGLVAS